LNYGAKQLIRSANVTKNAAKMQWRLIIREY